MKPLTVPNLQALAVIFFVLFSSVKLKAQNLENPGEYMTALNNAHVEMDKSYMAYTSAVAHSGRVRKIERMRQQTLESIDKCRYKILDLPIYKKDDSLRQSNIKYVQLCYKVFNEDYAHIVNMEEIAEQSFDEMQAYLLLQEKTEEKLKEASAQLETATQNFAKKYNVTLIDSKSELYDKMGVASKLNQYRNKVYLLFFKCNWQDGQITQAINQKKLNGIEQSRNALATYAKEGLQVLDTLKNFDGDPALTVACKNVLNFYKKLAESDMQKITDYFLKEENFEKMKKTFETKSESKRTQDDVDNYNKAVNDINASVNGFNQTNEIVNTGRKMAIDNFTNAEQQFMDVHMPHYK